jgi:hypothetical protein
VRRLEIEAGVAGKLSSLQDGNGGGGSSKSHGVGGSGDQRTVWASSEKALEGGGASVRGFRVREKTVRGGVDGLFEGHGGSVARGKEGRGRPHGGGRSMGSWFDAVRRLCRRRQRARGGGGLANRGARGRLTRRTRREGGPDVSGGVQERGEWCRRVDVSKRRAGPGFK